MTAYLWRFPGCGSTITIAGSSSHAGHPLDRSPRNDIAVDEAAEQTKISHSVSGAATMPTALRVWKQRARFDSTVLR